jgi:phosphocarrier protein FPr/phosphocarrier protein
MSSTPGESDVLAPLSGVLVPLASVLDPVFASGTVGPGVAIDPTSTAVLAPFAGTVTQLHRAHHAIALRRVDGLELLIHVGIDTVTLKGEGFSPQVALGDAVSAGQCLLTFDADALARRAPSLLTLVIVTSPDVASLQAGFGEVRAGRDPVFRVARRATPAAATDDAGPAVLGRAVFPNAAGLHARPAALIAAAAREFTAAITLRRGSANADARSVIALMLLGAQQGDAIEIEARGRDAGAAVARLAALIDAGAGDGAGSAPGATPTPAAAADTAGTARADGLYAGVAAAPGLAVGRLVQWRAAEYDVPATGGDLATETARLEGALAAAAADLDAAGAGRDATSRAQILAAHRELLADPGLVGAARAGLATGASAGHAWREAYRGYAARVAALPTALLRERAGDIRDVGERVLARLATARDASPEIPPGSILVADELTPSQTAALDPERVAGFCTVHGGATGHTAILARALGRPAVCGIDARSRALADGTLVILDGDRGLLDPAPDAGALATAREAQARAQAARSRALAVAGDAAITRDGARIEVGANVRDVTETEAAMRGGGDGIGLLRSEFLFADRTEAPSEAEQAGAYRAIAAAVGPDRRLVVRTLDVGGDKPLPYLPLPREENPFLGVRGIRVGLQHPEILATQLRAIASAASLTRLCIMFPMVATLEELRAARAVLAPIAAAAGSPIEVGIMVEVPSAALTAERLAAEADFFSIGTNDLTQYTLAMDRGHPALAAQADGLHPAVLRLIAMTVEAAHRHGRWVGVCGGLAGDAAAVPALIGLGVDELSVSPPAVATVKAQVRTLSRRDCQRLASSLLELGTAAEVRAAIASFSP